MCGLVWEMSWSVMWEVLCGDVWQPLGSRNLPKRWVWAGVLVWTGLLCRIQGWLALRV